MSKLILTTNVKNEKNTVISHFYRDLGSLIKIRGFQFIKHYDVQGKITALDWFSLSRNEILFTLNFTDPKPSLNIQLKPYLEKILRELSIFQLVDLFLFDELGLIEPEILQLRQQIITIFSSRLSVIGAVNNSNLSKIGYLKNRAKIDFFNIDTQNDEKVYLNLIRELYDW